MDGRKVFVLVAGAMWTLVGASAGCSMGDEGGAVGESPVVTMDAAPPFDSGDPGLDGGMDDATIDTGAPDAGGTGGDELIEDDFDPEETCSTCTDCGDNTPNPSCSVCSDQSIDAWLDNYLDGGVDGGPISDDAGLPVADASAQKAMGIKPALTDDQTKALNKCFSISSIIKYDTTRFNCQHYSYYTYKCLKRFGFSVDVAGIFCKNCSNPNYKNGRIGHAVIGVTLPGTPDQCCMAESEDTWPTAKRFCANAPCNWADLLAKANKMYCEGDPSYWFPGDTRKKDCVVSSASWDNSPPENACTAGNMACLVDAGIAPPFKPCKDRVGYTECMSKPWPKPNSSCGWYGYPPNQYCDDP